MPTPSYTVVPLGRDDLDELLWVDAAAFVVPSDPGARYDHLEWDRTRGVRAGDGELAAVSTTFSLDVALPHGPDGAGTRTAAMAGLSWVSVHPGHRRRGVLRQLITDHLHGVHERGLDDPAAEAISGLHASEPVIYPRFGYGLATTGARVRVGRGAALRPLEGSDDVRLRFVTADPDAHTDLVHDLYTRACTRRPGMVGRTRELSRAELYSTPRQLERAEPRRLLVAERDGVPTGYAVVRREISWNEADTPDGTTTVSELAAVDEVTEHRLWRAVTDFDLTSRTEASRLPADHPLLTWLDDPRAIQPTVVDQLWLRVVDLDRALGARGYATEVDAVLEVTDALCPWNAGRWRLHGGPEGATCERTDDEPDVALDVRELGSVLPGGVTLLALAAAGVVRELRPGRLAPLSTAFRAGVVPATTFAF